MVQHSGIPKKSAKALLRKAAELHTRLFAQGPPERGVFTAAIASFAAETGEDKCAGKPAGTPCFVWHNPDGSTTVCTCDGNGDCKYPE
jgi:hypothetical protein